MFKIITIALVSILTSPLSGCWQAVNVSDMEAASKICGGYRASVIEIYSRLDGEETVLCSNRIQYNIRNSNLPEGKI